MSQQSYNTVLRWKSALRIVSCNITFSCETPRNCRGVYLSFQVELKFEQVGFEEKSEKRSTWKRISLSIDPTITLPLRLLPHDYTNSMRMKKTSVDPVRQFSCFYFCAENRHCESSRVTSPLAVKHLETVEESIYRSRSNWNLNRLVLKKSRKNGAPEKEFL